MWVLKIWSGRTTLLPFPRAWRNQPGLKELKRRLKVIGTRIVNFVDVAKETRDHEANVEELLSILRQDVADKSNSTQKC